MTEGHLVPRVTGIMGMALLLVATLFGTSPAHADSVIDTNLVPSDAAKETATVSIPIRTVTSPGGRGSNGVILIRVGESAPIPVIVDTGFSGLVLFPGAFGSNTNRMGVGNRPMSLVGPDGQRIKGVRGQATMTLGGVTTVDEVPFMYANTANPYIKAWTAKRVYGLVGLGTKGLGSVNPLSALPGEFGIRWSLHFQRNVAGPAGRRGELVLGAEPPPESSMNFQLPYLGQNVNGALLWDDQAAPACWKIGRLREKCVPTQFDAAFNIMRLNGVTFTRAPKDSSGNLRTGTSVAMAAPSAAFEGYQFRAGNQGSRNVVKVKPRGRAKVITSNAIYFDYTVTYNTAIGRVYFTQPQGKVALIP